MLKKIAIVIGLIILILGVAIIAGKNVIAKTAITSGVKAITGLNLSIKEMNVGLRKTVIGISELKLYNPEGFPDQLMIDVPEIFVAYDLSAFLKQDIHLQEIRLELKEFNVIRNKEGKLNLDSLKPVQSEKKEQAPAAEQKPAGEKQPAPKIRIDVLQLKIAKVVYKDYTQGETPSVREFNVNINERFENITDPEALVKIILHRALAKTAIANLINFDLGSLKQGLKDYLPDAGDLLKGISGENTDSNQGSSEKTVDVMQEAVKNMPKRLQQMFPPKKAE